MAHEKLTKSANDWFDPSNPANPGYESMLTGGKSEPIKRTKVMGMPVSNYKYSQTTDDYYGKKRRGATFTVDGGATDLGLLIAKHSGGDPNKKRLIRDLYQASQRARAPRVTQVDAPGKKFGVDYDYLSTGKRSNPIDLLVPDTGKVSVAFLDDGRAYATPWARSITTRPGWINTFIHELAHVLTYGPEKYTTSELELTPGEDFF